MKNPIKLIIGDEINHIMQDWENHRSVKVKTIDFGIAEMPTVKARIAMLPSSTGFVREARLRVSESATGLVTTRNIDNIQQSTTADFNLNRVVVAFLGENIPLPRFLLLFGFLAMEWNSGAIKFER